MKEEWNVRIVLYKILCDTDLINIEKSLDCSMVKDLSILP